MKNSFSFLFLILFTTDLSAQTSNNLDITNQTIKINALSQEVLYYAFAEGDMIVFNFSEIYKKELKEIEIAEFPNNLKFSDYKVKNLENKIITVDKQGIYSFKFSNNSLLARVCRIKIQRIPASESTKKFDTKVIWKTINDTTWNIYHQDIFLRNDTSYNNVIKKVLVSSKLSEEIILQKNERVHSLTKINSINKSSVCFTLPANKIEDLNSIKVKSWAFWLGVDESGEKAWEENMTIVSQLVKGTAAYCISPLGALMAGAVVDLTIPTIGEDVIYALTNQIGESNFMSNKSYTSFDKGKGRASFKKISDENLCQGTFFLVMENDNTMIGINVDIKVAVVLEENIFEYQNVVEKTILPVYETRTIKEPILKTSKIPSFNN